MSNTTLSLSPEDLEIVQLMETHGLCETSKIVERPIPEVLEQFRRIQLDALKAHPHATWTEIIREVMPRPPGGWYTERFARRLLADPEIRQALRS